MEILRTQSHIPELKIALNHLAPEMPAKNYPVLFLHGSSFPSSLSFGFEMNNSSWMKNLSENGYDVYALDFLGYGNSDRYPEMKKPLTKVVGRAVDAFEDVQKAVDYNLERTGKNKIYLIGHSWGGSVAALYASKVPDKIEKLVLFAAITVKNEDSEIEKVNASSEEMSPSQRINAMKSLTPSDKECQLEPEIFETWGENWRKSDPLALNLKNSVVKYPSGPSADVEDLLHNNPYYDPKKITAQTMIIRGEWDKYPNNNDAEGLFLSLENAKSKKYVVIQKGTHVMQLEKSRIDLYNETLHFFNDEKFISDKKQHDIAVIFEVIPNKDCKENYLEIASNLKPQLEKIEGFISIERFYSISNPDKILSLSFWKDEKAIQEWRNLENHRNAQSKGRDFIFKDYHLRIANVVRDYGMFDRNETPTDSKKAHH
ncbi:alpha/beta fold hydrolase [Flavobacterium sp. HJSW_4]|uniref:alpha/beta fold hydrolase n=1 Tax=Flavobacterium sp. HJSW_4 TaxID=3344660 RepID=UPI0035F304FD